MQRCISHWILPLAVCLLLGSSAQAADLELAGTPAPLANLFNHSAHFVVQSNPAPVPGAGHREAFVVERPDISASTQYMYHRCFNSVPELCLSISNDNGATFSLYGTVVTQTAGHFSVSPSVARVPINPTGATAWVMVYEEGGSSGGTFWATSADGRTWSTSDNANTVIRDTLVTGGQCSAGSYPNSREKNHQCLPSCGGLGGTYCSQAKSCPSGRTRAGQSWDCASCCK